MAAEHIGADSVIHFGRSCLTPTQRLPVLNIYTVLPINTEAFESSILKSKEILYHRNIGKLEYPFIFSNIEFMHI